MNEDHVDEIIPMSEEEQKAEMFYRFKLIKEMYPDIPIPRVKKTSSLDKMKRLYGHIKLRIKCEKEQKEMNSLKIVLINVLGIKLDEKDEDGKDKIYTLEQLREIFDKRLSELGLTKGEFVLIVDIVATITIARSMK